MYCKVTYTIIIAYLYSDEQENTEEGEEIGMETENEDEEIEKGDAEEEDEEA